MTKRLKISRRFSLPLEAVTQTFGILAIRGVGKTYTAMVLAEEMLGAKQQVVVVDPIGVWWGLRASADGKASGLPIIVLGGDHGDAPLELSSGEIVADLVIDDRVSVVLDLSGFRKGEQARWMTDFCERLYHKNREPLHLIMDEADSFAPQRPQKGRERLLGAVEDLVRRGRARGLGITLVTQRAAVLNKDVLTQIEVLVALRTIAPQDRKAIDEWIKVHGSEAERDELMKSIASLPKGTAWFWSPGWLGCFEKVAIRKRFTFDSSATPKLGRRAAAPKHLADIDLDALEKKMAGAIERAKENDPRDLRKRIRELEAAASKRTVEPTIKPEDVEAAKSAAAAVMRASLVPLVVSIGDLLAEGEALAKKLSEIAESETTTTPLFKETSEVPPIYRNPRERAPAAYARKVDNADAPTNGSQGIGAGERALLTAVAQHPVGATKKALTVITGYKRSTRNTYLQRLSQRGLIQMRGELVEPTDEGVAALGNDFEPLPTGAALRDHYFQSLPMGEATILRVLVDAAPGGLSREAITENTDYKRSTRNTYLQRLGARQLIEFDGDEIRLAELLM